MAVKEYVNRLQRGVTVWNAWRKKHPENEIDLSHANLSGANLSGANLSDANLSDADLSDADLSDADLSGAHLIDATLRRATLRRATLSNGYLSGADLSSANVSGADLSHIYLSGAHLSGANLLNADLSSAHLSGANLSGANLIRANLSGADLSGANLSGAHLLRADLSGANLLRADLSGAKVGQTIFARLNLRIVEGLETIRHYRPSEISTSTLEKSNGEIPDIFLKGVGVSDTLIAYTHSLFRQPIEYYTCFISYSSKDELFAQRLHNDLRHEGVLCWFAPEDMDIGDKIRHRVDESIKLYDKLLLILSEHSIASTWVEYEVERALNKEPQGTPNVLYPVRVDQAVMTCTERWAHEIKSTRHIGNFEHWTDPQHYETNFKRLLRALNTKKEQQKK